MNMMTKIATVGTLVATVVAIAPGTVDAQRYPPGAGHHQGH
jgi:Spy/CpxP family protein refolding chaperone